MNEAKINAYNNIIKMSKSVKRNLLPILNKYLNTPITNGGEFTPVFDCEINKALTSIDSPTITCLRLLDNQTLPYNSVGIYIKSYYDKSNYIANYLYIGEIKNNILISFNIEITGNICSLGKVESVNESMDRLELDYKKKMIALQNEIPYGLIENKERYINDF
jgi:hypothetical protein